MNADDHVDPVDSASRSVEAQLTRPHLEELISLRLMLEEALRAARRAQRFRHGAAVVGLDAVVERAARLVAVSRNVTVGSKHTFDDLGSKLIQDLGDRWRPTTWPMVRKLHLARNAAQHEGLEPHPDDIPIWADAAEKFVASLTIAEFDIDVRKVVLADAITDSALAGLIRDAEAARDAGDTVTCAAALREAYLKASREWARLQRPVSTPSPARGEKPGRLVKDIQERLGRLEGRDVAQVFAPDLGEARWFARALSARPEHLDAPGVDRMLSFVFGWIVGFELQQDGWVSNWHRRAMQARRLERGGEGPARVAEVVGVDGRSGAAVVSFRCADVPPEETYYEWRNALTVALRPESQTTYPEPWSVNDDGTVDRRIDGNSPPDLEHDVNHLAVALASVEESLRRDQDQRATQAAERQAESEDWEAKLAPIVGEFSAWVADITRHDVGGNAATTSWEVSLTTQAQDLNSSNAYSAAGREPRVIKYYQDSVPGVDDASWSSTSLVLRPATSLDGLIEALRHFDPQMKDAMSARATSAARIHAIEGQARDALARHVAQEPAQPS